MFDEIEDMRLQIKFLRQEIKMKEDLLDKKLKQLYTLTALKKLNDHVPSSQVARAIRAKVQAMDNELTVLPSGGENAKSS